jgi:hypothetical protein
MTGEYPLICLARISTKVMDTPILTGFIESKLMKIMFILLVKRFT